VDRCNGLVNAGNYAARGFESVDEVRQATLGEPLQVDQVRRDALRAFNEQTNPETLLVDIRRDCIPSKSAPAWPAPAISSCTCRDEIVFRCRPGRRQAPADARHD
jgi:hypothetical protein